MHCNALFLLNAFFRQVDSCVILLISEWRSIIFLLKVVIEKSLHWYSCKCMAVGGRLRHLVSSPSWWSRVSQFSRFNHLNTWNDFWLVHTSDTPVYRCIIMFVSHSISSSCNVCVWGFLFIHPSSALPCGIIYFWEIFFYVVHFKAYSTVQFP